VLADKNCGVVHDYYSIWFNLNATFFIPEKKT
jgi:hypothetical protein